MTAPTPTRRRRRFAIVPATAAALITPLLVTSSGSASSVETSEVVATPSMKHEGFVPLPGAMSIAFSSRAPLAYVHARDGQGGVVVTFDISNPLDPRQLGRVDVPSLRYMEDVDLGERDGLAFVLVTQDDHMTVVEVTDPTKPEIVQSIKAHAHTWSCVGSDCRFVYTTASNKDGHFEVIDLTDIREARIVATVPSKVGTVIHDWHYDEAGVMWALGSDGIAAYDVADPEKPVLLNMTDKNGLKSPGNEYNDRGWFHGALRPNARRFDPQRSGAPSVDHGDVLLVSEEGDDVDCTDSFQTWRVPALDAEPGTGTITPISYWRLVDAPPGTWSPAVQLCSVHWFDFHQDGFVAIATYGNGTRLLDVRDPTEIRQVAYHFEAGDAAVQSYWVPERHSNGKATGSATNIIYTADAGNAANVLGPQAVVGGGIDIFRAQLPVP